jgi:hypothetical protein
VCPATAFEGRCAVCLGPAAQTQALVFRNCILRSPRRTRNGGLQTAALCTTASQLAQPRLPSAHNSKLTKHLGVPADRRPDLIVVRLADRDTLELRGGPEHGPSEPHGVALKRVRDHIHLHVLHAPPSAHSGGAGRVQGVRCLGSAAAGGTCVLSSPALDASTEALMRRSTSRLISFLRRRSKSRYLQGGLPSAVSSRLYGVGAIGASGLYGGGRGGVEGGGGGRSRGTWSSRRRARCCGTARGACRSGTRRCSRRSAPAKKRNVMNKAKRRQREKCDE